MDEREYAQGYRAEVRQGLWKRALMYDVPTYWFAAWFLGALLQVLGLGLGVLSPYFDSYIHGLMPVLFLCGGELMALQALQRKEPAWDTVLLLQVKAWWQGLTRYLQAR